MKNIMYKKDLQKRFLDIFGAEARFNESESFEELVDESNKIEIPDSCVQEYCHALYDCLALIIPEFTTEQSGILRKNTYSELGIVGFATGQNYLYIDFMLPEQNTNKLFKLFNSNKRRFINIMNEKRKENFVEVLVTNEQNRFQVLYKTSDFGYYKELPENLLSEKVVLEEGIVGYLLENKKYDYNYLPHLTLIAGGTGAGKTTMLKNIVASVKKLNATNVPFYYVGNPIEVFELNPTKTFDYSHFDLTEVYDFFRDLHLEVLERKGQQEKVKEPIIVGIDEFSTLWVKLNILNNKESEDIKYFIKTIALLGRDSNIHLVIASHTFAPYDNPFNEIKDNAMLKILFHEHKNRSCYDFFGQTTDKLSTDLGHFEFYWSENSEVKKGKSFWLDGKKIVNK